MSEFGFDDILGVLSRHGVRFVLIGGQAARLLGSPRVTYDVDACYARDEENLTRLAAALRELGARLRVAGMSDEDAEDLPFQIGDATLRAGCNFTFATRSGALDVLGQPSGVGGYDELASHAIEFDLGDMMIRVAAVDDLILMKAAAGRPKDLVDLEWLAAVREERETRDRLAEPAGVEDLEFRIPSSEDVPRPASFE